MSMIHLKTEFNSSNNRTFADFCQGQFNQFSQPDTVQYFLSTALQYMCLITRDLLDTRYTKHPPPPRLVGLSPTTPTHNKPSRSDQNTMTGV